MITTTIAERRAAAGVFDLPPGLHPVRDGQLRPRAQVMPPSLSQAELKAKAAAVLELREALARSTP